MHRFRFYVPGEDPRPIDDQGVEGPWWHSGDEFFGKYCIVVAFSPSREVLTSAKRWPDAFEIDDLGEQPVVFSERFPRPEWWDPGSQLIRDIIEGARISLGVAPETASRIIDKALARQESKMTLEGLESAHQPGQVDLSGATEEGANVPHLWTGDGYEARVMCRRCGASRAISPGEFATLPVFGCKGARRN